MKPWEVVATLLKAGQIHVIIPKADDPNPRDPYRIAAIICPRTGKQITLENVQTIQVEHWPEKHEHGGEVSPDNAVISLAEGHKRQTKKEARDKKHERKLRIAREALAAAEAHKAGTGRLVKVVPIGRRAEVSERPKGPGWRPKKKVGGRVVWVRTK